MMPLCLLTRGVMEIEISHYSKRGHGLGKVGTKEAEVVGAVVGDTLSVELGKRKKRKHQATLLEVLNPSSQRVTPRCVHAGVCGGCSWQQKAYTSQLQTKQETLQKLFPIKAEPIIPCEDPWYYRNKMEFSFSQNKEGDHFLGLIIARSRGHVLNLEMCHLTSPWFVQVLLSVKKWWVESGLQAYHTFRDTGALRTLTVREGKRTGDKMVFLTVSGNHDYFLNRTQLKNFQEAVLSALPNDNPSIFLRIQRLAKGKPTEFYEMHLQGPELLTEYLEIQGRKMQFHISPASFFQPNPRQAEKLYAQALTLAAPCSTDTVFDLYCGTGTLGVVFAPYVHKVVGMELSPYAVCDAEMNIEANQLTNISIRRGDVGDLLEKSSESPDIVIVDPPRSGLDPTALKHLLRLSPPKILYISCNPTTQSENISTFLEQGYFLQAIQPVDQFPHTPHVENIAILLKP